MRHLLLEKVIIYPKSIRDVIKFHKDFADEISSLSIVKHKNAFIIFTYPKTESEFSSSKSKIKVFIKISKELYTKMCDTYFDDMYFGYNNNDLRLTNYLHLVHEQDSIFDLETDKYITFNHLVFFNNNSTEYKEFMALYYRLELTLTLLSNLTPILEKKAGERLIRNYIKKMENLIFKIIDYKTLKKSNTDMSPYGEKENVWRENVKVINYMSPSGEDKIVWLK